MKRKDFDSIDSTNNYIKRLISGTEEDCVLTPALSRGESILVTASEQTGGRGRYGKSFFSPAGNIYMTYAFRNDLPEEKLLTVTPVTAVLVRRSIALAAPEAGTPEIKWVNDIILGGRKVCGILTELIADSEGRQWIIIGTGINVYRTDIPSELQGIAGSVSSRIYSPSDPLRSRIIELFASQLDSVFSSGFDPDDFTEEYRRCCRTLGKKITVQHRGGAAQDGTAIDIDGRFRLLVDFGGGDVRPVSAGEVSVRE